MLRRKGGATLTEIMAHTGWQRHTTRGWVSGFLGKKMGIAVESFKSQKGDRTSRINSYDPDLWTDEFAFLSQPGQGDIQSDLFYDYRTKALPVRAVRGPACDAHKCSERV